MKDERYLELKKDNNFLINQLSGSYYKTASIYIKKARGFASDTIDTEIKIQEVLNHLIDYEQRHILYSAAIPNETDFIESNINSLAKKVKDPNLVKSIIAIVIFFIAILLWVIINYWMKQPTPLKQPLNLKYELVEENRLKITWDLVEFASEGYIAWCIDSDGKKQGNFETFDNSYTFTIIDGKDYTFYVQARQTEYLTNSNESKIWYKNS